MPWKVVTLTTPLWEDHQRTSKAGKLAEGTLFSVSEAVVDGGLDMGHVIGEVLCTDGHKDGGWVELKNCETLSDSQPSTPGGIPVEIVGMKKKYLVTIEEVE